MKKREGKEMKNSIFAITGASLAAATAMNMVGVASASVSGAQGLYAKNYLLAEDGSAAQQVYNASTGYWKTNAFYSVMDVYLKFNSASGTGSNGERVVNFFGQATTDASTFGVNKTSKYEVSNGLAFHQQRQTLAANWCCCAGKQFHCSLHTWLFYSRHR